MNTPYTIVRISGTTSLLDGHLREMHANSPACSVHALDYEALRQPDITFLTARRDGVLLGGGGLRSLSDRDGELKSMRVHLDARGQGIAQAILEALIEQARNQGKRNLYLETGSQDFFRPARSLYAKYGFEDCPPFYHYKPDPNSVFMRRALD